MSVYEYQENLKEQKKVKEMETSTAEVIKREVVHQQMDAQVNTAVKCSEVNTAVKCSQGHHLQQMDAQVNTTVKCLKGHYHQQMNPQVNTAVQCSQGHYIVSFH